VWDVDGNCYLDFIAALGAASLGHAHPLVTAAIRGNVARGVLLSLPTHLEIEAAECVTSIVPNAEQVRFLKTGADACSAAVRLARLITGREAIATCGYHGWHDLFTPGTPGVGPAPSLAFDPFAEGSLEAVLAAHRVACVLLALPYDRVMTRERMQHLATLSRESGALFILDEVVTGFRLAPGGAQEFFGVDADLVCLSKGLGAGMPIAAVAGARRHMERFAELHVSTTYGGELLSLAVTIAVLNHYRSSGYAERIASLGMRFAEAVNTRAADLGLAPVVRGYAPIPCLRFAGDEPRHQECARLFVAEAARRGVLFRRDVNFITGAHSEEDIDFAAAACGRALDQVARRMRQNAA
jgi:aminotransferase MxcL